MKKRVTYMTAAFMTVFLDLLAFGLMLPDIQLRAESLNLTGWQIGFAISAFSIAQFLVAPSLGRLSDRIGRRKVLLVTCFIGAFSGFFYSFSTLVWALIASRIIGGIAGANLGVVYAYVADVTKPEERAKSMGMLGAAFGMGFIFGPAAGSLILRYSEGNPLYLGLASGVMSLINLAFVYFLMPEVEPADETARGGLVQQLKVLGNALTTPGLGFLLLLFFLANFAFSNLESTYFRMTKAVFNMSQMETTLVLIWVGIVSAAVQGGLIRVLLKKMSEMQLVRWGYLVMAPSLALVPYSPPWFWLMVGAAVLGLSSGVSGPSLNSLISRAAPAALMGGIFGVTQSMGALARIVGPIVGNSLFQYGPKVPYLVAGGLAFIPALASWIVKEPPPKSETAQSETALAH